MNKKSIKKHYENFTEDEKHTFDHALSMFTYAIRKFQELGFTAPEEIIFTNKDNAKEDEK